MPPQLLGEFHAAEKAFDRSAAQPMRQLAAEMKQEARSKQPDSPPLADWQRRGQRVGKELQSLAERLKALSRRGNSWTPGPKRPWRNCTRNSCSKRPRKPPANWDNCARRWPACKRSFSTWKAGQEESLDASRAAEESKVRGDGEKTGRPGAAGKRPPLAEAGELLQHERPQAMKQPQSAETPSAEEGGEQPAPPGEQEAPAAAEAKAANKSSDNASAKDAAKKRSGRGRRRSSSRLWAGRVQNSIRRSPPSGPRRQKRKRPRRRRRRRTAAKKLDARQFQKLAELDSAQQSLGSDLHSLDRLLSQLPQGQGSPPPQASDAPPQAGSQQQTGSQQQAGSEQQTGSEQQAGAATGRLTAAGRSATAFWFGATA